MKENKEENLEKFIDKLMEYDRLEHPSSNFVNQVMKQVEVLGEKKITVYKPLISKRAWFAMASLLVVMVAYLYTTSEPSQSSWLTSLNFDTIFNTNFSNPLSKLKFSNYTVYAVVFFAVMLSIQVPLVKQYLDKKYSFNS